MNSPCPALFQDFPSDLPEFRRSTEQLFKNLYRFKFNGKWSGEFAVHHGGGEFEFTTGPDLFTGPALFQDFPGICQNSGVAQNKLSNTYIVLNSTTMRVEW